MHLKSKVFSLLLSVLILASCFPFGQTDTKAVSVDTEVTEQALAAVDLSDTSESIGSVQITKTASVKEYSESKTVSNYTGDYYDDLGGLDYMLHSTNTNGLITSLRSLMNTTDKKHPTYSGTSSNTLAYWFKKSERAENDTHSGIKLFYTDNYTTGTNWNREHVWPQSLSGGLFGTTGAGADLHHIRPTYNKDNSTRGNLPYGNVKTVTKEVHVNGESNGAIIAYIGQTADGTQAFEPVDSYKGDVARIIAYMTIHYQSLYSLVDNVMVGGFDTIASWNKIDPVDAVEINRNNVAFTAQGNRNPFIDASELISVIWGDGLEEIDNAWNVTKNLKNFTSSNSATYVTYDSFFHTVLTVNDDCTYESVSITMGGVDITDTYFNYSTGVLYIPSVTGDLVITAIASGTGSSEEEEDPVTPVVPTESGFVRISSADELQVGDKIVVVVNETSAIKAEVSDNWLQSVDITVNGKTLDTEDESIMWTVEASPNSTDYFRLRSVSNSSVCLSGASNKTPVTLTSSGSDLKLSTNSAAPDSETQKFVITNVSNSNRFLGIDSGNADKGMKWYAAVNLSSDTYPHGTAVYRYVESVEDIEPDYNYNEVDGGIEISGVGITETKITIPDTIDGKTVVKVGDNAFAYSNVEEIVLPETVTEIGASAFSCCTSLKSVTLGSGVTVLGDDLFNNCSALTNIQLPDGVTEIPYGAFSGCSMLESFNFDNITAIGAHSFVGCISLTEIDIPSNVTSIGDGVFADCLELKSVSISTVLDKIPESLFEGCILLESVNIPSMTSEIGAAAFKHCESLKYIELPQAGDATVTLSKKNYLKKTQTGITAIGNEAFAECLSLVYIKLPKSVATIGDEAFSGCTSLIGAAVYNSNASFGENVFGNMTSTPKVYGYDGSTAQALADVKFVDLTSPDYRSANKTVKQAVSIATLRGAHYTAESYTALMEEISEAKSMIANQTGDSYEVDFKSYEVAQAVKNLDRLS